MVFTSLFQKLLFAFVIALFLLSFVWHRGHIIPKNSNFLKQLTLQEIWVQNMTTVKPTTYPAMEEKETIVLVWNWPWGVSFPLDKCQTDYGITGCKLSVDRSLYSSADAVVIHHADIMGNRNLLPQKPRPHFQHWVWYNMEPPRIITNLDMLDNLFNLTMTFRQDSDIFLPYGHFETLKDPQNVTIPTKTKLVSWVVSKWYPGAPRIAYYQELKKHIPIDVYGKDNIKLTWDDFYSTISQYKFYLAFENSIYRDYITEMLWSNAFGCWAVPVVLGTSRKNYERFAPGDSFIHVDDFPSPKELAAYLLELDKDDERYRKYFNWRSHYRVHGGYRAPYAHCKTCEFVKKNPNYQIIQSVSKWFLGEILY